MTFESLLHQNVDRFERFHAANPHVWSVFRTLSNDLVRNGSAERNSRGYVSAYKTMHELRGIVKKTTDTDGTKLRISNDVIPFYGRHFNRWLLRRLPHYDKLYEERRLTSANRPPKKGPLQPVLRFTAEEEAEAWLNAKLDEMLDEEL